MNPAICGLYATNLAAQATHRRTGPEPEVIAQVPLVDGGPLEVHGYATFWTQEEVDVAWTDDRGSTYQCWVPASQVRRPSPGEWHGNYLPR